MTFNIWKLPTQRQLRQRALAWKLRMVLGAMGTLYPREKDLPPNVNNQLKSICNQLASVAIDIRWHLRNIK